MSIKSLRASQIPTLLGSESTIQTFAQPRPEASGQRQFHPTAHPLDSVPALLPRHYSFLAIPHSTPPPLSSTPHPAVTRARRIRPLRTLPRVLAYGSAPRCRLNPPALPTTNTQSLPPPFELPTTSKMHKREQKIPIRTLRNSNRSSAHCLKIVSDEFQNIIDSHTDR